MAIHLARPTWHQARQNEVSAEPISVLSQLHQLECVSPPNSIHKSQRWLEAVPMLSWSRRER
eukprot:scaffold473515_cov34-Prasinocladus_malaysianus.AAC.1